MLIYPEKKSKVGHPDRFSTIAGRKAGGMLRVTDFLKALETTTAIKRCKSHVTQPGIVEFLTCHFTVAAFRSRYKILQKVVISRLFMVGFLYVGKEKTNKHKEFWRDTPWCASRLSRGHVPSVPWYVPSVPGTFCPFSIDLHINQAQMSQVSLGRPEFVPGTPPGHPTAKFLYVIFLYRFFSRSSDFFSKV